jgi:hypothetical protein
MRKTTLGLALLLLVGMLPIVHAVDQNTLATPAKTDTKQVKKGHHRKHGGKRAAKQSSVPAASPTTATPAK